MLYVKEMASFQPTSFQRKGILPSLFLRRPQTPAHYFIFGLEILQQKQRCGFPCPA